MSKQYLNIKRNTCAARIFLNTFDLVLEDIGDVNIFSEIKIFDKAMNEVGKLHFDNGKVIMSANYNNNTLKACYDIPEIFGGIDKEYGNALYGHWSSKIAFQVNNKNNTKLSGEFLIENSIDSEFGVSCLCHPLINCEIPEKGNIILKILRYSMFELEIISGDYYETIFLSPGDSLNGFIRHDITIGKYDKEQKSYPYEKYASITDGKKGRLRVYLCEKEYKNKLTLHKEFIPEVGSNNSTETLLQKGFLMQKLDPDMIRKINQLRELLLIGNISLFDNLISICYDSYTDEKIKALLGVKRQKMDYQDGADNLADSYYGIGKNSCFLSAEVQKKLLRK